MTSSSDSPRPTVIETACLDDLEPLVELLGQLFAQEAEFQPNASRQRAGIRAILDQPALGWILVARSGGKVVGMINVLTSVSTALGGPVGTVEDFVVRPEFRGSGIGQALFAAMLTESRRIGLLRLTLLTDADNLAAQRFYSRQGFVVSTMRTMRLALERPPASD
jgi:ribosomal protein S18 acetylase RimI-like enzyme